MFFYILSYKLKHKIKDIQFLWYEFGKPFIVKDLCNQWDIKKFSDVTVLDIINIKLYNIKTFHFWRLRNNWALKDDTLNNTIVKKFYLFCIQHSESHHIKYNELLVVWDIYCTSRRKKHLRETKLRNFFCIFFVGSITYCK